MRALGLFVERVTMRPNTRWSPPHGAIEANIRHETDQPLLHLGAH